MSNTPTAYFIFFCPKGVSAHPIAVYFDKKKAFDHMKTANREYVQLRLCAWKEGILPSWSETSFVDVPETKIKKKKETNKNESDTGIPIT